MTDIEKNVPIPRPRRLTTAVRKLSVVARTILETLPKCEVGDSFLVPGQYKRVAMNGGRIAKRLGVKIRVAQETPDVTRIWRLPPTVIVVVP